ncbi:MAG: transglycosylase family protein [Acidimicrobiales bacterium]
MALATVPTGAAAADPADAKRAEAARITDDLAAQASRVVDADRRLRDAQSRLADVQESLRQAETGLRAATATQQEARRRLAVEAVDAYTHGGSVSVLGKRLQAGSNLAVYDTYLSLVSGLDRSAVEGLRSATQDLDARQAVLTATLAKAKADSDRITGERAVLLSAEDAQRANLATVNGEVASLVAAEQARRAQEAAAAAVRITVAAVPRVVSSPGSGAGPPASTAPTSASPHAATGDPFACIRQLESGNNYRAPGGGAYQIQDATWHSLGYTGSAQDYPPDVQDAAAHQLQAREGWGPWTTAPLCGLI